MHQEWIHQDSFIYHWLIHFWLVDATTFLRALHQHNETFHGVFADSIIWWLSVTSKAIYSTTHSQHSKTLFLHCWSLSRQPTPKLNFGVKIKVGCSLKEAIRFSPSKLGDSKTEYVWRLNFCKIICQRCLYLHEKLKKQKN